MLSIFLDFVEGKIPKAYEIWSQLWKETDLELFVLFLHYLFPMKYEL